jgi:hypothetical protein
MKRSMATCLIMLTLAALSNITSAAITNGGFESGDLTGWTSVYTNDGSNGGYNNQASATTNYYYSGTHSLWGYADVTSVDWHPNYDWSRTYVWSDYQDLSGATSVKLYLSNFISSFNHSSWGWGQDVFLMLDDGTNQASVLLVENHEQTYLSLFDLGLYTDSQGGDGNTWHCFDAPLSTNPNYFGAGFSDLNLSNTKVGICWEAISWNAYSGTLWSGAAVDNIQIVPEPATICLLGLGALSLLRRKR